jgi:hypothetical protein
MDFARRAGKVGRITQHAESMQLVATDRPDGHQTVPRKDGMTVA